MLKFSYHLSSSESDLRPEEMSDTASYNSSLKEGDHSCDECDKRKRALSKERTRLSRHHSRSRERLNYNNNRSNYDSSTLTAPSSGPSSITSNYDTSDGQESMTCTTSTSNSEMSSVSNSFYRRFTQLRSRSKSRDGGNTSRGGRRSDSPEKSGYDEDGSGSGSGGERRGRRGLWELQKAASRVIGPDSRMGRWVGKLRSRSSEARLGSLKSRYSDIQNWEGWKLEERIPPSENELVSPTLLVNDEPVTPRKLRPVFGKKIFRSRSTEAVNWTIKEDQAMDFTRRLPVRKSFEKAMKNKIEFSDLGYNAPKSRLHSRFESEPNLTRSNMYEQSMNGRYLDVVDDREYEYRHRQRNATSRERKNYEPSNANHNRENNQRIDTVPRRQRRSCRSAERGRDVDNRRPVSCHFDDDYPRYETHRPMSLNFDESPRRRLYQKNQRVSQTMTLPRNLHKPPNGHRYQQQALDTEREISRSGRYSVQEATIKYEKIQFVKPSDSPEDSHRHSHHQRHRGRDYRKNNGHNYQDRDQRSGIPRPDSRSHSSNSSRRNRERSFDRNEPKPVLARYIPPQTTNNEGRVKQCSLKPVPIAKVASTKKTKSSNAPQQNLSTQVSASCTALHEIHSSNNLKRCQSEQQLKRRSLASLSSVDSGTSCSEDRASPNSNGKDNQSNISAISSDSGYRSPSSNGSDKKDYKELETLVLSSCFGEDAKSQQSDKVARGKKPVLSTSDYESESGYDDKLVKPDARRMKFQQTAMRLRSTERFQESDEDQCVMKQQKSGRRSPKKTKSNGPRSNRSSSNSRDQGTIPQTTGAGMDISHLTTKVRARLNHKPLSPAELMVRRGDTLYLNRESLAGDALWVLAYSTNSGDAGLIPTVILSSRMEDLV